MSKLEVKQSLLQEQGYLCCYTGRRIDFHTSHIEHLVPQAICTNHQDTEYSNLLAAFPSDRVNQECSYGAHHKKDWYDEYLFVHPLREDCEKRFRYRDSGEVVPENPKDTGAAETIGHLNLNDKELQNLRKGAISAMLDEDDLTQGQVSKIIAAMDRLNGNGKYHEFCFVIKQACERHLRRYR